MIEASTIPIIPPRNPFAQTASSGCLGDGVNYRLLVTGEMKSKQVARLIRLLEAQKEFMAEDEDETNQPRPQGVAVEVNSSL